MFFFSRIAEAFKRWNRNKSFMEGGTVFMGTPGGKMVNMGTITDFKMTMSSKEPLPAISDEQHVRESLLEGKCPDCESMKFLAGHGSGAGQNYMCAHCGHRFNIAFMGNLAFAERIGEKPC